MSKYNFNDSFFKSAADRLIAQYTKDLEMSNVQYEYSVNLGKIKKYECRDLLPGLLKEIEKSVTNCEVSVYYSGFSCYLEMRLWK